MTEHEHTRDHDGHDPDHDPDHGHDHHGHVHGPPPGEGEYVPADAAASSLARALRMSFRLLTILILVVAVLFVMTGVTTIDSGEKGIVTIFGRQVAVVEPGLRCTWPFPIGHIDKVAVRDQTLRVMQFWVGETPEDKTKDLASRMVFEKGLRPGWDGALLTGDAYLVHAKLDCTFRVDQPLLYRSGVADPNAAVVATVCRAAVLSAARQTADGLVRDSDQARLFVQDVARLANESLTALRAGILVKEVRVVELTWPLRVLPDAQAAQNAEQQQQTAMSGAIRDAGDFLNKVAGPEYVKLVGRPWEEPGASADSEAYDLIGQYERARRDPNLQARSEKILARIDEVLASPATTGEVSSIVSAAKGYRDTVVSAVHARQELVARLLPEYRKDPDGFLQRIWTDTRGQILQSPTVVKWFLPSSDGKTILKVNTPPEIIKEMGRWYLQAAATAGATGTPGRSAAP